MTRKCRNIHFVYCMWKDAATIFLIDTGTTMVKLRCSISICMYSKRKNECSSAQGYVLKSDQGSCLCDIRICEV